MIRSSLGYGEYTAIAGAPKHSTWEVVDKV